MNIFFSFCVLLATSTLLALPANSSVNFTTMRHVFVRGEAARFDLSAELSPDAQIKMEVAGITGSLTPGGKTNVSWTLDTNLLKAGDYTVNAAARAGDRTLATNSFAFTIAPPRNPQRFPVWCWGWGKFAAPMDSTAVSALAQPSLWPRTRRSLRRGECCLTRRRDKAWTWGFTCARCAQQR